MSVIQEAFFVPDDIAVGLASGIYKRFGGVVRWAVGPQKGQIVKHLKAIPIQQTVESATIAQKAFKLISRDKKIAYAAVAVAGVAVAGGGAYSINKVIKKRKFQKAFNTYVEAVRSGTVTVDTIEKLEKVLPELGSIQLSSEELGNLVGIFKDYTIKLAKDNGQEMDDDKPSETPIIDFKKYLEMQKRIIKTA